MTKQKYVPFLMWLFPVLFFAYQFILRLWPSLMMEQIMHQFAINASGFGVLASLYYYGYSGMQIPVAMLLDRFGARSVLFCGALLCGVSMFIFTTTDNWYLACLSRCLIGVGSAVGFLGTSKVISEWFPKDQYGRMIGFSFTIGLMGALYGGKPISLLVESQGWQTVALTLACVSMVLGVMTYLLLRSPKTSPSSVEAEPFKLTHFRTLLSAPVIWLIAIANFFMVGSLEFADLWGVSYLMTAYELSKSDAAELISCVFVGMIFGGPFLIALSKRVGTYTVLSLCGVGMAALFLLLLANISDNGYWLAGLLFLLGILCCYQVIMFAACSDLVSPQLLCISVAFLNCVNMQGGSFFHPTIGFMMDAFWTGMASSDGVRQYTVETYQIALLLIPLCALVGACLVGLVGLRLRQNKVVLVQDS
jgi:predicted MFS family arabinose efflux permease